jgi:hypothetical protein
MSHSSGIDATSVVISVVTPSIRLLGTIASPSQRSLRASVTSVPASGGVEAVAGGVPLAAAPRKRVNFGPAGAAADAGMLRSMSVPQATVRPASRA